MEQAALPDDDIVAALRDLRRDPFVAEVLRRGAIARANTASPPRASDIPHGATDATPSFEFRLRASPFFAGDRAPVGAYTATAVSPPPFASEFDALRAVTPGPPPPPNFYRERDRARDTVGLANWVQSHRDELSNSEAKRVEGRLQAEHLFAVTQLQIKELLRPMSGLGAAAQEAVEAVEAADARGAAPLGVSSNGESAFAATCAPQPAADGAHARRPVLREDFDVPQTAAATVASPIESVAVLNSRSAAAPSAFDVAASLVFDSSDAGPPPFVPFASSEAEREEVYHRKLRELAGEHSHSDAAEATPVLATALAGNASEGARRGAEDGKAAREAQDRADADVAALSEAIEQRDRTIARLERAVADERAAFDAAAARHRAELASARAEAAAQAAALRANDATHAADATAAASVASAAETEAKLEAFQREYRAAVDAVRAEAAVQLARFRSDAEARIREVGDAAEAAIHAARGAFANERREAAQGGEAAILRRVARAQEAMLRDAELKLRDSVERAVVDRARADIARDVRALLRSEGFGPLVAARVVAEASAAASAAAVRDVHAAFDARAAALEEAAARHLRAGGDKYSLPATAGGDSEAVPASEDSDDTAALLGEVERLHAQLERVAAVQQQTDSKMREVEAAGQRHHASMESHFQRLHILNETLGSGVAAASAGAVSSRSVSDASHPRSVVSRLESVRATAAARPSSVLPSHTSVSVAAAGRAGGSAALTSRSVTPTTSAADSSSLPGAFGSPVPVGALGSERSSVAAPPLATRNAFVMPAADGSGVFVSSDDTISEVRV